MIKNRVRESTSTTGTGSFTLTGAPTGYRTFNTAFGLDVRFRYWAINPTNSQWETGIGYLSGTTTLVRETFLDGTASTPVNFTTAPSLLCGPERGSYSPAYTGGINPSGVYLSPHYNGNSALEDASWATNEIHYMPFLNNSVGPYDNFGIDVRAVAASSVCRMGLYDVKAGVPHNLIVVHDTSFSLLTGIKQLSIDGGSIRIPVGWYFIALWFSGTSLTLDGYPVAGCLPSPIGSNSNATPSNYTSYQKTVTYAAMPDPAHTGLTKIATTESMIGLVAT